MSSSRFAPALRNLSRTPAARVNSAQFSTSRKLLSSATAAPARPLGAFRGGIYGFLFGSMITSASAYYYILKEYKLSNEMLTEDIYALQAATQRLSTYVAELEGRLDQLQRKK